MLNFRFTRVLLSLLLSAVTISIFAGGRETLSGVPDWDRFETSYRLILRGEPDGWSGLRELQDEPGEVGDITLWLLFREAREQGDRLLAIHYTNYLLKREIPQMMIEEVLEFTLQTHHEVGAFDQALKLYEANRSRTSAKFQRYFRSKEAYYLFSIGDKGYKKKFRTIFRRGSDRERLELFLLMKGKEKLLATENLLRVLEGCTTLQRWDLFSDVRALLKKRRLSSAQKQQILYLEGRRFFRLQSFREAIVCYERVARSAKGEIKNKAIYQSARCYLYLKDRKKAEKQFTSIRGKLSDVALYTRARLAIYDSSWSSSENLRSRVRSRRLREKLSLLMAIARLRDGEVAEARKILEELPETEERNYWLWKCDPQSSPIPQPGLSFFSYVLWDGESIPASDINNLCTPVQSTEAHTFIQFLYNRRYSELLLPFAGKLASGWDLSDRCVKAEVYLAGGLPDRSISSLWEECERQRRKPLQQWPEDLKRYTFPRGYEKEVRSASLKWKIPENLLFAVIRQESLFRAETHSAAGARGLMQLMPSTAKGLDPEALDYNLPAKNIDLGARYLAELYARYGRWDHVVAAYNAGEAAVDIWIDQLGPAGMDYFYSFVPYRETKRYVERVFAGWLVYESYPATSG